MMLLACSLIVDTKGLSTGGGEPDVVGDRDALGSADGEADSSIPDANVDAGADVDAGPSLVETFDGPIDKTKYNVSGGPTFTVEATGGALHIVSNATADAFGYLQTKKRYDARNEDVVVHIVDAGKATQGGADPAIVWFKLIADPTGENAVEIGVNEGDFYAKKFVNGTETVTKSITYVPATMQWARIREASGTTYYEHAADGGGPWTTFFTEPTPISLSSIVVEIGAGGFPGKVGEVVFDDLRGF